mgnify:CR=1 FL=1
MAIGTCAYFEREWIAKLPDGVRQKLVIQRYMDDVLGAHSKFDAGAQDAMTDLVSGGCYPAPLTLTNDDDAHFLETVIIPTIGNIEFKHWNKNLGGKQEYYKGKHYHSIGQMTHKIGAIQGTFIRIDRNCSNAKVFNEAIQEKVTELLGLGYPKKLLQNILYNMHTIKDGAMEKHTTQTGGYYQIFNEYTKQTINSLWSRKIDPNPVNRPKSVG